MGRFLEVTPRGEVVWEYIVPFYAARRTGGFGHMAYGLTNATYRCIRYGPDYPGLQGKRFTTDKLAPWNQLYGPGAFGSVPQPAYDGMEGTSLDQGDVSGEKNAEHIHYYAESQPSVGESKRRKKAHSRLKLLGY